MLSFEDVQEALTGIADEIPQPIYEGLNGGVILLPERKLHPQNVAGDLYILGEYHVEPRGFGRYITLYYGSFRRVHGHLSDDALIRELKAVLFHELTHHLESLAGDATLEYRDEDDIARYLERRRPKE
jgi:hypothetical protein